MFHLHSRSQLQTVFVKFHFSVLTKWHRQLTISSGERTMQSKMNKQSSAPLFNSKSMKGSNANDDSFETWFQNRYLHIVFTLTGTLNWAWKLSQAYNGNLLPALVREQLSVFLFICHMPVSKFSKNRSWLEVLSVFSVQFLLGQTAQYKSWDAGNDWSVHCISFISSLWLYCCHLGCLWQGWG